MTDLKAPPLPDSIMVWHGWKPLSHIGTWSTTRYPDDAVEYVPKFAIEAAVLAEREACAKVAHLYHVKACERMENDPDDADRHEECASTAGSIAQAIRARGEGRP